MTALARSRGVLELLSETLGFVPFIGENLKCAAELASKICEGIQTIQENREAYRRLGRQVQGLMFAISGIVEQEKGQEDSLAARKPHLECLKKVLDEIWAVVHERVLSHRLPTRTSSRIFSFVKRAFHDMKRISCDTGELKNMRLKLQAVMNQFGITSLILTEMNMQRVLARMMQFCEAQNAEKDRIQRLEKMQSKTLDIALLDTLRPVTTAAWTRLSTCTPNTRVSVLHEIETWIRTPHSPCVFWLNGLAGTGKSTIAATVCERLENKQLLGASFFVSRQHVDRRDASDIVRSIAHELALRNCRLAEALCAKLRETSAALARSVGKQITDFVITPAHEMDAQSTLVIVIDALDECFLDARGRPGGDLLLELVRQLLSLSGRIKLFITSRNEPSIQRMFNQLSATAQQQVMKLHDLDDASVQRDIRTYLVRAFDTIREDRSSELSLSSWPDEHDLCRLVRQSSLLFIYSATVVRFLSSQQHSPPNRLAQLLGYQQASGAPSCYHRLDELYMRILLDAVDTSEGIRDPALCERLHAVVAVIVLARTPMLVDALAVLSGVRLDDVRVVLRYLTCLLLMNTDEEPVRVFHPSFPDFITDTARCTIDSLRVDPHLDHGVLALRCLGTLNQTLHYDMCDIRDPATANKTVPDLAQRLREKVERWNAVRYASCFWADHLVNCSEPFSELLDALEEFCSKHLFHWLEVLSLMEYLLPVERELPRVIKWCEMHFPKNNLAASLLYDTIRTWQVYYLPIRSHALHAYHSAFITMPKCPLQQTLALGDLPSSLPVLVSPRASHWGPPTRILEGHQSQVFSVAFSPDGKRIASASFDQTVRIWDVATFEELAKLEGHQGAIMCVAFSSDGTRLASGSRDRTLRIWNPVTFEELAVLEGHQDCVRCMAFSLDGTRVTSGSDDCTVRIWDAVNFAELAKLEGHQDSVWSIAFSPDGARIASGSIHRTVRIWNVGTFEEVAKFEGDAGSMWCVAFSPDGKCMASGSRDCILRIRDAYTFEELAVLEGHHGWIRSMAFSPDGARLASGSDDFTVRIWNTATFVELAKLEGHQDSIWSIAFTPDGSQIASGSIDRTVRIWNAATFEELAMLDGHQGLIASVAFSSDGTRLTSGSRDRTLRIWNPLKFEELAVLEGHQDCVRCAAFSRDGTRIASGSDDGTLRIWDAVTFAELAKLEGHEGSICSVTISPDSTRIASGSQDHVIRIWDTRTFEKLAVLNGHQDRVRCMAFSPDGTRIVSGSHDRTVRIWDAVTFKELAKLEGHHHWIICVAFSPDGTTALSQDTSGATRAWVCSPVGNAVWIEVSSLLPRFMHNAPGFTEFTLGSSGWLESVAGSREPVLWLPLERRGQQIASSESRVVMGGRTGAITVLDMSKHIYL